MLLLKLCIQVVIVMMNYWVAVPPSAYSYKNHLCNSINSVLTEIISENITICIKKFKNYPRQFVKYLRMEIEPCCNKDF